MRMMKYVFPLITCVMLNYSAPAQTINEILGRPADSSITMSILLDQQSDVYWEYGTLSGTYPFITATYIAAKDIALKVDFTGLSADTKYYYRTRYRLTGSGTSFLAGPERTFHTQRSPGSTFTFTIESDEHLYDFSAGVQHCHFIGNSTANGFLSGDFHYLSTHQIALGGRLIKNENVEVLYGSVFCRRVAVVLQGYR